MDHGAWAWPAGTLSALRLGRRLGVRLPASQPHRVVLRAHRPRRRSAGEAVIRPGRPHGDDGRGFRITHWEFEADSLEGYDRDLGAVRLRDATAADEKQLLAILQEWRISPEDFCCSWDTVGLF